MAVCPTVVVVIEELNVGWAVRCAAGVVAVSRPAVVVGVVGLLFLLFLLSSTEFVVVVITVSTIPMLLVCVVCILVHLPLHLLDLLL